MNRLIKVDKNKLTPKHIYIGQKQAHHKWSSQIQNNIFMNFDIIKYIV